ncbi:MAG: hypothetical protein A2Y40_08600 [Candidatus Margulisbacteria bacterium GWF2_35_9]|nr:MAG: hypothetical protein A2Y40_08600 [Candidatus Margulisbacteria bacterium GWF2_35_9]
MKKLIILLVVIFTMGTFALDVNMNVQGSVGFALDVDAKAAQDQSFGDVRPTFMIKKGDTTLYWMPKTSASTLVDYMFVDTMTGLGMLRVGLQRIGLANNVAGPYATSTFLLGAVQKGTGMGIATKIAGMTTRITLLGNMWLLDDGTANTATNKASLSALVDLGVFGVKVGGVYNVDNTSGATKNGLSGYVEAKQMMAGMTVAGAAFIDLSDDAAAASLCNYLSQTKARRLVQAYVAYPLGAVELRGSYTTDLNKATIDNEIIGAVKYALSPEVNAWFTYTMSKAAGGAETKSGVVSVEFLVI